MAAAAVPWTTIALLAIEITTAAKAAYDKWRLKAKPAPIDPHAEVQTQIGAIAQRLEALEANETAQVKLLEQMAEQVNTLSVAVTRLHKRNLAALSLACVALVICIFLLIR